MFNKRVCVVFLLLTLILGSIFAKEAVDESNTGQEVSAEMRARLVNQVKKYRKDIREQDIIVNRLEPVGVKGTERYEAYEKIFTTGTQKKHYLSAIYLVVKDSIYEIPDEYNKYIRDMGEAITEENAFEKVEEMIKMWTVVPVEIEKIEWKNLSFTGSSKKNSDSIDEAYGGYTYRIEAISYSAEYDIRIRWSIGYFNQRFSMIRSSPVNFTSKIFEEPFFMGSISFIDTRDSDPDGNIDVQANEEQKKYVISDIFSKKSDKKLSRGILLD